MRLRLFRVSMVLDHLMRVARGYYLPPFVYNSGQVKIYCLSSDYS